jgi:metal-responsive CopG/Arc/MetJ family transcriptional regulator
MPASVKTAISMQQQLFDDVNSLASELNISRSKLFVIAVEEFLKKNENKNMLSQINEAFADFPNERENSNTQIMKRKQKKILENDAW